MPPRKPIRFSVGGTMSLGTFEQVVEIAQTLEELGFDGFYSSDHMYGVGGGGPMRAMYTQLLEAWTVMAGLAPVTKTLKLGCMVTGVTYRHPAMLAKICSTIDVMSNGRLILGIGAAWSKGDHDAYGIPFPGLKVRQEMLGEALDVVHGLWTERSFSYEGKHYRLEDAPMEPKPVQQPRPPVLIAAVGETGLALTAKHAQYWASLSTPAYAGGEDRAHRGALRRAGPRPQRDRVHALLRHGAHRRRRADAGGHRETGGAGCGSGARPLRRATASKGSRWRRGCGPAP